MQNIHKPHSQTKAMPAENYFGMRFREGIFVISLITLLAYILTS